MEIAIISAMGVIIAALLGVFAFRIDMVGLLKRNDERKIMRARMACPHMTMQSREDGIAYQIMPTSPPMTHQAVCPMCQKIFPTLDDAVAEVKTWFREDDVAASVEVWARKMNEFNKAVRRL